MPSQAIMHVTRTAPCMHAYLKVLDLLAERLHRAAQPALRCLLGQHGRVDAHKRHACMHACMRAGCACTQSASVTVHACCAYRAGARARTSKCSTCSPSACTARRSQRCAASLASTAGSMRSCAAASAALANGFNLASRSHSLNVSCADCRHVRIMSYAP